MGCDSCTGLPEPQIVARELADRRAAHQSHVPLDFGPDQVESTLHAGLTGRSQRIEIVATEADGFSANGERLQHVAAALDPPVHKYVDPIAHGIDNLGQLVE